MNAYSFQRSCVGRGKKRLTTAERWKKKKEKKEVEDDENSINITKLTELANELLTRTGNMDIYQESYEQIKKKVVYHDESVIARSEISKILSRWKCLQVEVGEKRAHPSKQEAELDMYADDFDEKEKAKLDESESNYTSRVIILVHNYVHVTHSISTFRQCQRGSEFRKR